MYKGLVRFHLISGNAMKNDKDVLKRYFFKLEGNESGWCSESKTTSGENEVFL